MHQERDGVFHDRVQRARERLGTLLRGKYRLDRILGVGGMGAIYEATHRNKAKFAVKVLHPELTASPTVRKRFQREGYAANSVGHPGAVRVVDDDVTEDGAAFLVMELLVGASVEALWEDFGLRMPVPVASAVMDELLDLLASAHRQGVVHRDVKPGNLFVTRDGAVKVLDFGVARALEADGNPHLTGAGMPIGTPAFMAPEQAVSKFAEVDARTDIWAAGATLFALVSGRTVHEGETSALVLVKAATEKATPLASVAPMVPAEIAAVVDRALCFERSERWPSAAAMREALEAACRAAKVEHASKRALAELVAEHARHAPTSGKADPFAPTAVGGGGPPSAPQRAQETSVPVASTRSPGEARPRAAKRLRILSAAIALLAVVGAVGLRVRGRRQPMPVPATSAVATATSATPAGSNATSRGPQLRPVIIPEFEVAVSDAMLDSVLDTILKHSLYRSRSLDPYGGATLRVLAGDTGSADDYVGLARVLLSRGAPDVVIARGAITTDRNGYMLTVHATNGRDGARIADLTRVAPRRDQIVPTVALLAGDLRTALGDAPSDGEGPLAEQPGLSLLLEADHDYVLAQTLGRTEQNQLAAVRLEHALKLDPSFAEAHEALGTTFYNLDRYADATREYGFATQLDHGLSERRRLRIEGDYFTMLGDYDRAIGALEDSLRSWPRDAAVLVSLSEAYALARRPARALEIGRQLVADHPNMIQAQLNLAEYELLSGDYAASEQTALKTIEQHAHAGPAISAYLGAARALEGKLTESEDAFRALAATNPPASAAALGDLYLFEGRTDDAVAVLEPVIAVEAGDVELDYASATLAFARLRRGDRTGALQAAARAARSNEPAALHAAASVCAAGGDAAAAIAIARRLESPVGPDAAMYSKLVVAEVARTGGQLQQALAAARDALRMSDSWLGHFELARTCVDLGDWARAREELRICADRRGEGAQVYLGGRPTLRYVALVAPLLARTELR